MTQERPSPGFLVAKYTFCQKIASHSTCHFSCADPAARPFACQSHHLPTNRFDERGFRFPQNIRAMQPQLPTIPVDMFGL